MFEAGRLEVAHAHRPSLPGLHSGSWVKGQFGEGAEVSVRVSGMGLRILGFFLQRTSSAGEGPGVSTAWGGRMGEGVAKLSLPPSLRGCTRGVGSP